MSEGDLQTHERKYIAVDKLEVDSANGREREWNPEGDELDEALVASVEENGVDNPVITRELEDGGYGVISGSRRLNAAKDVGVEEIPCIVDVYSEIEAMQLFLLHDLQPALLDHTDAEIED